MKYEVIADFYDGRDNNRLYRTGDAYPRKGYQASNRRIEQLSTHKNSGGKPFIKKIEEAEAEPEE